MTLTAPPTPDPLFLGSVFDTIRLVESSDVTKLILPKSSPFDFIPTSLLKSCSSTFGDTIERLANLSFSQGHLPTKYKQAIVTPLLKKLGLDHSNPLNYRPSQISTVSQNYASAYFYICFKLTYVAVLTSVHSNQLTKPTILLKQHFYTYLIKSTLQLMKVGRQF